MSISAKTVERCCLAGLQQILGPWTVQECQYVKYSNISLI